MFYQEYTSSLDTSSLMTAFTTPVTYTGSLNVGYNSSASEEYIQIGQNRTGNAYAYIDLVGDTTYTDFGLRLIRNNGGPNTSSSIYHRGTGSLEFITSDAAPINICTNNTVR